MLESWSWKLGVIRRSRSRKKIIWSIKPIKSEPITILKPNLVQEIYKNYSQKPEPGLFKREPKLRAGKKGAGSPTLLPTHVL